MNYKECEFKNKCFYSNRDCNLIKDVCVHGEKLTELAQLGDQYNAVVAQNKSLQGELRLYKKALELMAEEVDANNTNHTYFDAENKECSAIVFYYKYALQELEAENDN